MPGQPHEEFVLGGMAAMGAGFFTNPLEVVKTRMQLQGELKARGQYAVHYRNSLHAFYTIFKSDGIIALQSGLIPALWYQKDFQLWLLHTLLKLQLKHYGKS
jgi:solute carrier family 25 protein 34/35